MTPPDAVVAEFGESPYGFFHVLRDGHPNPNLDRQRTVAVWSEEFARAPWWSEWGRSAEVALVTDNGEYVFEVDGGVLLWSPRDDLHEVYELALLDFLRYARSLRTEIIPDDL